MDDKQFDILVKMLSMRGSRRAAVKLISATIGGIALMHRRGLSAAPESVDICHVSSNPEKSPKRITVPAAAAQELLGQGDFRFVDCCRDADCAAASTCVQGRCESSCPQGRCGTQCGCPDGQACVDDAYCCVLDRLGRCCQHEVLDSNRACCFSGLLDAENQCCDYALDSAGRCCESAVLNATGACCLVLSSDSECCDDLGGVVDIYTGACCSTGLLNENQQCCDVPNGEGTVCCDFHGGVVDGEGQCCESGLLDGDGACCACRDGEICLVKDVDGTCCASEVLDKDSRCCIGLLDVDQTCCQWELDAAGRCCDYTVDNNGTCCTNDVLDNDFVCCESAVLGSAEPFGPTGYCCSTGQKDSVFGTCCESGLTTQPAFGPDYPVCCLPDEQGECCIVGPDGACCASGVIGYVFTDGIGSHGACCESGLLYEGTDRCCPLESVYETNKCCEWLGPAGGVDLAGNCCASFLPNGYCCAVDAMDSCCDTRVFDVDGLCCTSAEPVPFEEPPVYLETSCEPVCTVCATHDQCSTGFCCCNCCVPEPPGRICVCGEFT